MSLGAADYSSYEALAAAIERADTAMYSEKANRKRLAAKASEERPAETPSDYAMR